MRLDTQISALLSQVCERPVGKISTVGSPSSSSSSDVASVRLLSCLHPIPRILSGIRSYRALYVRARAASPVSGLDFQTARVCYKQEWVCEWVFGSLSGWEIVEVGEYEVQFSVSFHVKCVILQSIYARKKKNSKSCCFAQVKSTR